MAVLALQQAIAALPCDMTAVYFTSLMVPSTVWQ
jgi:hypothetical protein